MIDGRPSFRQKIFECVADTVIFSLNRSNRNFTDENFRYYFDDGDRILRLALECDENTDLNSWEKYCTTCKIWRPPRAHHCRKCGYCMVRSHFMSFAAVVNFVLVCRYDLIITVKFWGHVLRETTTVSLPYFWFVLKPAAVCLLLEESGD